MPLTKPPLANVSPGQPVTAQGWNAVLAAITQLYDGVNALGTESITVNVLSGGNPVAGAVVVAVPATGTSSPVVAIPPHAGDNTYRLTELTVGNWNVHVAAAGFAPKSTPISVPGGPFTITLTATSNPMPNVIGMLAPAALTALASAGVTVELVLDVFGESIPPTSLPANRQGSKVLAQTPDPGTPIDSTARARVVLSAVPEVQQTVQIPPIMGLTFEEARRLLNDAGLEVGRVMSRTPRTFGQ